MDWCGMDFEIQEELGVRAGPAPDSQRPAGPRRSRLRVLCLSRNYPSSEMPRLGLWVERLVRCCLETWEPKVIAPVPYFPPLPCFPRYSRFRKVETTRWVDGVEVFHPRIFVGPGYSLYNFESLTYYLAVRRLVDRIRRDFPFQLIHAHFSYPDGWVAARLGRKYGVPVIITEHAPWLPWMNQYPRVRRQAVWAIRHSAFVIAVSRSVRDSISHFAGELDHLRVVPNVLDGDTFKLPRAGDRFKSSQILFVGFMRMVKGLDVLLKAIRLLADRGRTVDLVIVGESFTESYRRDERRLREMVRELGLESRVRFAGPKSPAEVCRYMQESALLVLPSRAESFGTVLVEALACGTPVVATRCGGPEDIVKDGVGVLVPREDPEALARGIERVLDLRAAFDPTALRAYALEQFGSRPVSLRLASLYQEAIERFQGSRSVN